MRIGEYNTATGIDCAETEYGTECIDPVQDIGIEEAIPYQLQNKDSLFKNDDIALLRLNRTVRFTGMLVFTTISPQNSVHKRIF